MKISSKWHFSEIKSWGDINICLVSPELQGQPIESIFQFSKYKTIADAICTKQPDEWEKV